MYSKDAEIPPAKPATKVKFYKYFWTPKILVILIKYFTKIVKLLSCNVDYIKYK